MRNLLAAVLGSALLAGMMSAGGCVSLDDYKKLEAMNRNVNEELKTAKDRLRLAEGEIADLKGQLADRDRTIAYLQKQVADLTAANNSMRSELAAAQAELKRLGQIPVGPVGPLGPVLNAALKEFARLHPELVEFDERNGMVKFKADLTFDPGSVEVKPAAAAALKRFAEILNIPEAKQFNVYVAGHTDDIRLAKPETIAKHEDNWGLSLHRAKAVVKVLYDNSAGVEQERMGAMGFSRYHPIAANAPGNKGNVANRRVEVWIVPNTLLLTMPTGSIPVEKKAGPEAGD